MSFSALHSDCVPPDQRFDWWCELISQDVAPTRITTEHTGDFPAGAGAIGLGGIQVTTLSFPAIRSERTPALIRRSDPEVYELTLNEGGDMWITQARNEAMMRAGDLSVWSTSRPFDARGLRTAGDGTCRAVMVHLPRAELPFSDARTDQLLASATATDRGTAAVFARFVRHLVDEAPALSDQQRTRLGPALWELAVAFLADRLNAHDRVPPEARTRMLLARIDAFIDDHLADPALTPPPSPPGTTSPYARSTPSSGRESGLWPPRSITGAWSAAARTWRTRPCAAPPLRDRRQMGLPQSARLQPGLPRGVRNTAR
ncbi:AraC family transcriptional regulator [Streptomyces alboflavus]|uniref:AraC family transcriptional regulator n=1 Tax=Streptomyces alboflavus TaxID=67267 RepID=A0A1Z1W430_9ACTN|nr:AraC family transcriptional regulator [Streptomyces alboflavus]ARX81176.1 AraC family transcriptional regulator [Streptomyces alboflavus]